MSGVQSGVAVHDEVIKEFESMKITSKKVTKKVKCLILKFDDLNNPKYIVLDNIVDTIAAESLESPQALLHSLPEDEPRFIVYDFAFKKLNGAQTEKLILIKWCPDAAKIKQKMFSASSFGTLKSKLNGVALILELNDIEESLDSSLVEKLSSKS